MSPKPKDALNPRPQLFSVVGAAYVPEEHGDHNRDGRSQGPQPGAGVAAIWLVFYAVLAGISLFTSGGAAKLIEYASAIAN